MRVGCENLYTLTGPTVGNTEYYLYRASDGNKVSPGGGAVAYGSSWTTGDKITVLLDMDAGTVSFGKNGVDQGIAFTGVTAAQIPFCSPLAGAPEMRVSTTNTHTFSGYRQWR
jgi:hypothetical protein